MRLAALLLRRFPWRIVRASALAASAADLADREQVIEQYRKRDRILFDNLRHIEWRLSLCHSRAQDATAAWKIAKRLIADHAPPSSWWDISNASRGL